MTEPELGSGALREALAKRQIIYTWPDQQKSGIPDKVVFSVEDWKAVEDALSLSSPIEPDSSKALRTQISKYCDECPDLQLAFAKDRLLSIALVWTAPTPQASSEVRELPMRWRQKVNTLHRLGETNQILAAWVCECADELDRALAPSRQGAGGK